MKKFIPILLILTITIFSYFYSEKNLINIVADSFENYEILESEKTLQVVKINVIDLNEIVETLNVEVVSKKEVSGRVIIEGYLSSLENYIVINNRKINIQISCDGNTTIIGCPLIKNSF